MRKVIKLVVVVAVILFQTSSGQKLDVPYGTEWQQGLSEYYAVSFSAHLLVKALERISD